MEDPFNDVKDMLRVTRSNKFSKHHTWWEMATAPSLSQHVSNWTHFKLDVEDWSRPPSVPIRSVTDGCFESKEHQPQWHVPLDIMADKKCPLKHRKAGPHAMKREAAATH
eukprot:2344473-Karenia_brevis.AAC.1